MKVKLWSIWWDGGNGGCNFAGKEAGETVRQLNKISCSNKFCEDNNKFRDWQQVKVRSTCMREFFLLKTLWSNDTLLI